MSAGRVQSASAFGDNATSVTRAFSSNVTSGNLIVVGGIKSSGAGGTPASDPFASGDCTKSAGTATVGTVALDKQVERHATGTGGSNEWIAAAAYSVPVTGSGSCTIQLAGMLASTYSIITVSEYSSMDVTGSRVAGTPTSGSGVGGSNVAVSAGSGTTTADGVFFGVLAADPDNSGVGTGTITRDGNFADVFTYGTNDHMIGSVEDRVVSSGTTDDATWSWAATAVDYCCVQVVYKGATAGAVTVLPGLGAPAITGFAPTVIQMLRVLPGLCTIALAGIAAIPKLSLYTRPGVAAPVVTGIAPATRLGLAVRPGVGAIAMTGYAPAVLQNLRVKPGVASLTVDGYVPDFYPAGLDDWAGNDLDAAATPGAASLVMTGYAPALQLTVRPGVGSAAITGIAPRALLTLRVRPGVGTVTVTGFPVTRNDQRLARLAVVLMDGYAPAMRQALHEQAGLGTLSITGYAPDLKIQNPNTTIALPAGPTSVTLTGYVPVIGIDVVIATAIAAVQFDGYAPTLNLTVAPGTASMVFSGTQSKLGGPIRAKSVQAAGATVLRRAIG